MIQNSLLLTQMIKILVIKAYVNKAFNFTNLQNNANNKPNNANFITNITQNCFYNAKITTNRSF